MPSSRRRRFDDYAEVYGRSEVLVTLPLLFLFFQAVPGVNTNISTPSDLIGVFEALQGRWLLSADSFATGLFWALAAVDVAWFAIRLWWNAKGDLSTAMAAVVNKVLVLGMFAALLANGSVWFTAIIDSFEQIGKEASGVPAITPSLIMATGLQIAEALLGGA